MEEQTKTQKGGMIRKSAKTQSEFVKMRAKCGTAEFP